MEAQAATSDAKFDGAATSPARALVEEALVAFSDQRMLHGEHRRRTVSAAASRPTDASRRRGQGGTRRCHRSSQPLETLFVRRIDEPISWSTAKIALASSPRPYAVDVTIRRVLRGCANKRTQNTAGPTPVRGPRGSVASGTLTALDAGARRVGIPQTTGPVELRATASTAERGQVFARPVDDLWSSSASRDWYGASPRPHAIQRGAAQGLAWQLCGCGCSFDESH